MSTLDLQTLFRRADTLNGRGQAIENWSVKNLTHTVAEIKADGYLDIAVNQFSLADRISATGSDGSEELIVTAINASAPRVITIPFIGLFIPADDLLVGGSSNIPIAVTQSQLIRGLLTFEVSFETGEQFTDLDISQIPRDATLVSFSNVVTKTIAGTDAATISFSTAVQGVMTPSTTFAANASVGTLSVNNFATNNILAAETRLRVTSAKTTAGGKARCNIIWAASLPPAP